MWKWIKWSAALFAIGILAAVIAFFVYGHSYDLKLQRNFDRVTTGMNEQQVLSMMGKPDAIGKCGELGGFPNDCYQEFLYKEESFPSTNTLRLSH